MSNFTLEEKVLVNCLAKGMRFPSARVFYNLQISGKDHWVFPETMTEDEKATFRQNREIAVAEEVDRLQKLYFDRVAA